MSVSQQNSHKSEGILQKENFEMAFNVNRYQTLPEYSNNEVENQQPNSLAFHRRQPWGWNQRSGSYITISGTNHNVFDTSARVLNSGSNVLSNTAEGVTLSPDRLLSSCFLSASDDKFQRSTVHLPSKLPSWLWALLSYGLGLSQAKPVPHGRLCVSTSLHIVTLATALCYGACGLIFNIYDTLSAFTKTTVLVCIAKSVLGIFWILLGTYSHALAARLFSSKGLLDYIRLHSKTFMKISTVVWISLLGMAVVGTNFYSNRYLLGDESYTENQTDVMDATCASVGLKIILCQIYIGSKMVFSCLNLIWNLVVVGVCLSVCRTHTVCIRRFMKELSYDSRIYEEFHMLNMPPQQLRAGSLRQELDEYDICDDDFTNIEDELEVPSNGENVLQNLRIIRHKRISQSSNTVVNSSGSHLQDGVEEIPDEDEEHKDEVREVELKECAQENYRKDTDASDSKEGTDPNTDEMDNDPLFENLSKMKAPIMGNEDLMFTYFKINKHLRSTSRLLQRWMCSWIVFVMMWCAMLIIYWVSHTAKLTGIFQFLGPLVVLGLLASAYSEVNFEGQRLLQCILPTEDRMSVIYYVQNSPLELKVYSFVVTYNVLVTVVAGVAVTFATRIVLDSVV